MAPDAAADLLADLSKETSEELLDEMPGREANEVRELLEFDPATAGGMMNTEFVYVSESATRDEVLEWLRKQDQSFDQLDTVVLLDDKAQYSGVVPVVRMLLAGSDERLLSLKMEPLISLPPQADEKEVFELFDKYNLRMLTVVDNDNRPIGAITVDDVVSHLVKH
jgi:Mg/Co/Ni transporter MgtE